VAYIAAKSKKVKPLTDADWVRPGRAATDEEMEKLADEMEKETEWFTPEEVMASVKKRLAEWRKSRK